MHLCYRLESVYHVLLIAGVWDSLTRRWGVIVTYYITLMEERGGGGGGGRGWGVCLARVTNKYYSYHGDKYCFQIDCG